MNVLTARIRRRLLGTRYVQVFKDGATLTADDDVVKVRLRRDGVRIWALWGGWKHEPEYEVVEFWFPRPDEVRVGR
jgi:hypothetical protein